MSRKTGVKDRRSPLDKDIKVRTKMAYIKKQYRMKNVIEVEEYHTGRYGAPGQARKKKRKLTPEQMAKVNQRNKEKECRRKLRQHFNVNDYFVDLTYLKDSRPPDMDAAKKHFREFMRVVRREYKKRGQALKWIRNIEVGQRNAWHVHLVINRIPDSDLIIRKAWKMGKVIIQNLTPDGEFKRLAEYITKSPVTEERLIESDYSSSRNLPIPDPEVHKYKRWKTWRADPRILDGYYIDAESMFEGENPVTGYPYRTYSLFRIQRD